MRVLKQIILYTALIPAFVNGQSGTNPDIEIARMKFMAKQVIPPSPEAAELGKYGNVPVSLFAGKPNISLPLLELKGAVLSLPVSLSYNSPGFKPEEIAPWTGLGWAMNTGGVITRSAMGDPDMDDNYFVSPSPLSTVPTDEYQKQLYFNQMRSKQIETQPDIYYYNFMGQSGKFLIMPDGTVINKEKSFIQIVRWTGSSGQKVFTITDESGIQYEFFELETTTTTPLDDQSGTSMTPRSFISAWYLSKVLSPYGNEELIFEYYNPSQAQSIIGQSLALNSATYSKTKRTQIVQDPFTLAYYDLGPWELDPRTSSSTSFQAPAVSITIKYLKKVTHKKNAVITGYIDFESNTNEREDLGYADFDGERILKGISLFSTENGNNILIKKIRLNYEYFGAAQSGTQNFKRLKLKTVQELSPDSSSTPSKPPYTFYYTGESNPMPQRSTTAIDHWGFYNSNENFAGGIPNLIPTVNIAAPNYPAGFVTLNGPAGLGANREPDFPSALNTILEKIVYPTGGYTTFEYEGNSVAPNRIVGGVRIKKITDHSFPDKPAIMRLFEYKKADETNSGYLTKEPLYYEFSQYTFNGSCPPFPPSNPQLLERYSVTLSTNSVYGLGTIQGSHVVYEQVTEYQTDVSTGQKLGKKVSRFNIQGYNEIDDLIGNGDLVKQEVYNNNDKLIEEISNTYVYESFLPVIINRKIMPLANQSSSTTLGKNPSTGVYVYYDQSGCMNGSLPQTHPPVLLVPTQYMVVENNIQQQRKKLAEQTTKIYDGETNSYLISSKLFTYGNAAHNYPTLIEQRDSKQEKFFTAIKYVADYTISCTPQTGSMASKISEMKSKNMMGIPVEKLQYRESAGGGNRRYISGQFTEYKVGLPEKIYFLEAKPMPITVTTSEASCTSNTLQTIDPNYRLAATITYDADMNLKEESKTNDVVTTYFWGYGKIYPVAKVTGKTSAETSPSGINQVLLDNPPSEAALRNELNKLRNLTGALVTTYTYKPMVGISSETDIRGKTVFFEYDVLNRLVNIKDNEGFIVKNFKYGYGLGAAPTTSAQTLYYNSAVQQNFTKTGCSAGLYGDIVTYSVPYGKHVSSLSQQDANNKAATDIINNGQAYANSVGLCRYYSTARHVKKFKNDCTPEQGLGLFAWYDIPAGKYKSLISQADADAMATTDVATLGQAYANANATCSCAAEGKRVINGVCETGTLYHASSVQQPNGQWQCAYYYVFSDSYTTGYYYYYSSSPCPIDP